MSESKPDAHARTQMGQLISGKLEANGPMVGIMMGSESDRAVMDAACAELEQRGSATR